MDYFVSFLIGFLVIAFMMLVVLAMIKFPMILIGLFVVASILLVYLVGDSTKSMLQHWRDGDF